MTRTPPLNVVLVLSMLVVFMGCSDPVPEGVEDAQADELARGMMTSVDAEAWKRTGAISWTFADRNNHLWDRRRRLARVRMDDVEVLINLRTREGMATRDGDQLSNEEREEVVEQAYEVWVNDTFWLTAMNKPFDSGTTRSRVTQEDGKEALLVQYASGGVTPGDAYLWHFDDDGRPVSWEMWVSLLPIGGVSVTWDQWVELPTGAFVSTRRELGPLTIEVTDLDAAETVADLVDGPDPFEPLDPR